MPEVFSEAIIPSFGRRKGRSLSPRKQHLMETLLPELQLQLPESGFLNIEGLFSNKHNEYWMEIGFGGGEHLAHQADKHKDVGFIGCEVYKNGIASLLGHIDDKSINNVALYADDARDVLKLLPENALQRVFLLFPDPWPKERHHKRRFVTKDTLVELHRVMRTGGIFRIATDISDYARWSLVQLFEHGGFAWSADNKSGWSVAPEDHYPTRYEKKAAKEGRAPVFLDFVVK